MVANQVKTTEGGVGPASHAQVLQHGQGQHHHQQGAAPGTWAQAPAHHGASFAYTPTPAPNFETPQFAHNQAFHPHASAWHASTTPTLSGGHQSALAERHVPDAVRVRAAYVHPPPTPQADAEAAMHNAYNEPGVPAGGRGLGRDWDRVPARGWGLGWD